MIFLIEYDRQLGKKVTFRRFADSQRREAYDARLEIELDLNRRGMRHEVVILEAENEAAIRKTHRRYFETLEEILQSGIDELKKSPFARTDGSAGDKPG